MIKKLILATIASMVLVSGMAGAARPDRELQTFNVVMFGAITTSTAGVESGPANLGNNQRLIDFSLKPFDLENYWREHSYETAPELACLRSTPLQFFARSKNRMR